MSDLTISNSRITLTCGAKNSGAITSIVLDGQELLSFTTKSEGIQNIWKFHSSAYSAICNEGGAANELPGDDSSSRFISGEQVGDVISTSTYTAYNEALEYGGQTLECSGNKFSKRIRANYLSNPGIVELKELYEIYSAPANEIFSWSLQASLVEDLRNFFLFNAQPLGVGLPAGAPELIGVTTEEGLAIPANIYGGMICSSVDQSLAIGIYTHNVSFEKNQLYHGATSAQIISPIISTLSVVEVNGPDIRTSVGRHSRTRYLCVGTFTEVLNQFVQLYNHLTNTIVAPPIGQATHLTVTPSSISAGVGSAFSVQVRAVNSFGGVDTQYQGSVHATLFGSGTLSGTVTRSCVNGAVNFTGLSIDTAGASDVVFTSGTLTRTLLNVVISNPVPTINLLNPTTAVEDSPEFALSVFGTNFVPGSVVQWGGVDKETQFISDTELRATILAADIFTAGTFNVRAVNPAPGGGISGTLPFTVTASILPLTFRSSWMHDFNQPIADLRPYDFGDGLQWLVSKDVDGWSILNPTIGASNLALNAAFENVEGSPQAIAAQYDAITSPSTKRAWIASGRVRKAVRLSDAARMDDEDVSFNVVGTVDREYIQDLEIDQTHALLYTLTLDGGLYCESIATPSAPTTAATAINLKAFLVAGETCKDLALWTVAGQEACFVLTSTRILVVKNVSGALTYISTTESISGATDTNPVTANSINAIRPIIADRLKVALDGDGLLVAYTVVQCLGYELPVISRPFSRLIFLCNLDLAGGYAAPKFKQTITSGANTGKTYYVFYNPFPVAPAGWSAHVASAVPRQNSDGTATIQKVDYHVWQFQCVTTGGRNYLYVAHGKRNQVRKVNVTKAFSTGISVGATISCHPNYVADSTPPTTSAALDLAQIDIDPTNKNRFVVTEYRNQGARIIDLSVAPTVNYLLPNTRFDQTCQHDNAPVSLSGMAWTLWSVEFRFSAYNFRAINASTNTLAVLYEKGWPMASDGAVALPPDAVYTLTFGGLNTWKPTGPGGAWRMDQAAFRANRVDNPELPGTWLELNTEQIDIGLAVSGAGDDRLFVVSGAGGFMEYKIDSITKNPSSPRFFTFPAFFTGDTDARLPGWSQLGSGTYYSNECVYVVIDGVPHIITDIINRPRCEWAVLAYAYNSGTDTWDFVNAAIVPTAYPAYTAPLTSHTHVTKDLANRFAIVSADDAYFVVRLDELVSNSRMTVCDVQYTKPFATINSGIATSLGRLFVCLKGTAAEAQGSIIVYDFDTTTGVVDVSNPVQTLNRSSIVLPVGHTWKLTWQARFRATDAATGGGGLYLTTADGMVLEFVYSGGIAAPASTYVHIDTVPTGTLIDGQFDINASIRLNSPNGSIATAESGSMIISLVPEDGSSVGSLSGTLTRPVTAGLAAFTGLSIELPGDYRFRVSHTPAPGGVFAVEAISSPATPIYNPRPVLSSIAPAVHVPTSANVLLTARGGRFIQNDSQISFNGSLLTTTFVDSGTLQATLVNPAIISSGSYPVLIHTDRGVTEDSALTLNMLVSPLVIPPTISPATDLAFAATPATPLFVSQTFSFSVKAVAPSGAINTATTGGVRFSVSPAPGWTGALTGNTVVPFSAGIATFFGEVQDEGIYLFKATHSPISGAPLSPVSQSIDIFNRDPSLSSLAPNPIPARPGAVGIQIFGSRFISDDSVATFDSMDRTTTFVNNTQLIITLDPLDINAIGTHSIRVRNEHAQNLSNALTLTVNSPTTAPPTSASLSTVSLSAPTLLGDGNTTATVTVTLRNTSNVLVPHRFVSMITDTDLNSFTPAAGYTNGSGVFVSIIRSVEPGAHIIRADVDDGSTALISLNQQPVLTVTQNTGHVSFLPPQIQVYKGTNVGALGSASALAIRDLGTTYEVYIVGSTNDDTLLSSQGVTGFKPILPTNTANAWIGRFDEDLTWLSGTYFGGSGATDIATGIVLDEGLGNNGVIISGVARSFNFPHTFGIPATTNGPYAAWVANFNFALDQYNWSTLLGPHSSVSNSIAVDSTSTPPAVYAAGKTKLFISVPTAAPSVFAVGATKAQAASTTIQLAAPAGTLTGKTLVAVVATSAGTAHTPPAGWSSYLQKSFTTTGIVVFAAHVSAVGTGPYTFTMNAAGNLHGVVVALSNVDTGVAFISAIGDVSAIDVSGTLMTAPSITTQTDNNGVLWIGLDKSTNHTSSGYSGINPAFTEIVDGAITGGSMCLHLAYGPMATAGSTGDRTANLNIASTERMAVMIAIAPVDPVITQSWQKDSATIGFGLPFVGMTSAMVINKLNASSGAFIKRTSIEGVIAEKSFGEDTLESGILIDAAAPHNLTLYGTIQSTLQTPGTGLPSYNSFKGGGTVLDLAAGDALLISLSNNLSTIAWSRYIGTVNGDDSSANRGSTFFSYGKNIARAASGDILVGGRVGLGAGFDLAGTPFQATAASPSPGSYSATKDMFIMRLSSTGATVLNSTYLGGHDNERVNQIMEDRVGRIWAVGDSDSAATGAFQAYQPGTLPITFQQLNTPTTGQRAYIASLTADLRYLNYALCMPSAGLDALGTVTGIANPRVGEYILCGNLASTTDTPPGFWIAKMYQDLDLVFYSPYSDPLDVSPPTPDPATWATVPFAVSSSSISMTATTATDSATPVLYSFDVPTGIPAGPGQVSSGWQSSATYVPTGLSASTVYWWETKSQDGFGNETAPSSPAVSATTLAAADVTAPTPNPATWATVPFATSTTSTSMTATTGSDPSAPVQYSFENLTTGGHNSGWQNSSTYLDSGLTPGSTQSYRHQLRDSQVVPNVGGYSTTANVTIPSSANVPTLSGITHPTEDNATGAATMVWPHLISVRSSVDGHGLATTVTVEIAEDSGFTVNYRSFAAARGTITATQAQNGPRKVGKHIRDCSPLTPYYIRFKAVSSAGTAYGPVKQVTTPATGLTGIMPVTLNWVKTVSTQISSTEIRTYFTGEDHKARRFAYRFELFSNAGLTTLVEQHDGFYHGPLEWLNAGTGVLYAGRAELWYAYNNLTPATDYWIRLTTWNSWDKSTITKQITTQSTTNWLPMTVDQKKAENRWGFIHSDFRNPASAYISENTPVVFGVDEYDGSHTQHSTAGHGGGLAGEDAYTVYADPTGFTTMWNMVKTSTTDSSSNSILTRAARALKGIGGVIRVSGTLRGSDWASASSRASTPDANNEAYWDNGLTGVSQVFYPITYVRIQSASSTTRAIVTTQITFTDRLGGLNGLYWKNIDFKLISPGGSKWSVFFPANSDFAVGTVGFYSCLFYCDPTFTSFAGNGCQFQVRSTGVSTADFRDCRFTPAQEHSVYVNSLGALGRTPSFFLRNEVLDYVIHNGGVPYGPSAWRANGRTMFQTDSRGDLVTPSQTQVGMAPGRGEIYFVDNIARSGRAGELAGSISLPGHHGPIYIKNHTFLGNPITGEEDAKVMNTVDDVGKGSWLNENGFAVDSVTISKSSAGPNSFTTSLNNAQASLLLIHGCEDFTVADPPSITTTQAVIFGFTEDLPPGQARSVGMATLSWAGTANDALRLSSSWPTATWVDTRRVRHEFSATNLGTPVFNNTSGTPQTNFTILSKGFVFEAIV
jgi:hypothetical protein